MTFFSKIDNLSLMKEDRKKCSDLMEEANILMKSVDYWNEKMNSIVKKYEILLSKDHHSVQELKRMEALDSEIDVLSHRLDLEYSSIQSMEGKIEKELILNQEKKNDLKKTKKKGKNKKPKKPKKPK